MRIDYLHIRPQIEELLDFYHGLIEATTDNNSISLLGKISINRTYNSFQIDKDYEVKICIPLNNDRLPDVWDTGNQIDKSYVHRYSDGKLCLETDAYVALGFYNGNSLLQWMTNVVEPYYYSYEYYSRFGEFPFGERGHDLNGVIEAYQQIFNEQDTTKIFKLLRAISYRKYRGHLPCPCGSGKATRKCHGIRIIPFVSNEQLYGIAYKDYMSINEVIKNL